MLIAPLSLSNFVTVAAAGLRVWSAVPQLRGAAAAFGASFLAFRALALDTRAMAVRGDLPPLPGVRDRSPR